VALAFAAACSVLGDTALNAAGVRGALRGALAQLRTRPLVALRVHPQDLQLLRSDSAIAELITRHGAAGALQWRADEQVVLGGCVLETAEGTLDARLETQLEALRASLLATRAACAAKAAQAALPEGGAP
jgi:flagellar assembly protein FliH